MGYDDSLIWAEYRPLVTETVGVWLWLMLMMSLILLFGGIILLSESPSLKIWATGATLVTCGSVFAFGKVYRGVFGLVTKVAEDHQLKHGRVCWEQTLKVYQASFANGSRIAAHGLTPTIVRRGLSYAAEQQVELMEGNKRHEGHNQLLLIREVQRFFREIGNEGANGILSLDDSA